jgi:hypothetical protein
MWYNELCKRWLGRPSLDGHARRPPAQRGGLRLILEELEDRTVPSTFTAASVSDLIADINAANLTAEADTITLVAGNTFTLTQVIDSTDGETGLPVIALNENLTIIGNGDIIERSTATGTPAFRLFQVVAGASLTLQNLTLQGGLAFGYGGVGYPYTARGGAILNLGTLTLDGVTVQNNTAQGADGGLGYGFNFGGASAAGGGLYSSGVLTMSSCIIQNNAANGGRGASGSGIPDVGTVGPSAGGSGYGGGLYVGGGTIAISSSSFTSNTARGGDGGDGYKTWGGAHGGNGFGGGLYAAGGTITVHNGSVTGNAAQGGKGGAKGWPHTSNGSSGQGCGGGIYIDPAAAVGLDAFTVDHAKHNQASTSAKDIFGSYDVIL